GPASPAIADLHKIMTVAGESARSRSDAAAVRDYSACGLCSAERGGTMQTVLIADDHPLFREAVRDVVGRLFSQAGWAFECLEATSMQEALSLVDRAQEVDLILLDLFMPGTRDLSGLIALRARVPS